MARSFCPSVALALLLLPLAAHAHPIDELAQASYVGITLNAITVELDLIPGEQVDAAFDREIRQKDYPKSVGSALHLSLDGKPVSLEVVRTEKRELGQRLLFRATLPEMTTGAHLLQFENTYAPIKSGYLASTLAADEQITIGEQHRDARQQTLSINFQIRGRSDTRRIWLAVALPILALMALLARWWPAGRK